MMEDMKRTGGSGYGGYPAMHEKKPGDRNCLSFFISDGYALLLSG